MATTTSTSPTRREPSLLGQTVDFEFQRTVVLGALNAVVAVPFYLLLDRLKVTD